MLPSKVSMWDPWPLENSSLILSLPLHVGIGLSLLMKRKFSGWFTCKLNLINFFPLSGQHFLFFYKQHQSYSSLIYTLKKLQAIKFCQNVDSHLCLTLFLLGAQQLPKQSTTLLGAFIPSKVIGGTIVFCNVNNELKWREKKGA